MTMMMDDDIEDGDGDDGKVDDVVGDDNYGGDGGDDDDGDDYGDSSDYGFLALAHVLRHLTPW